MARWPLSVPLRLLLSAPPVIVEADGSGETSTTTGSGESSHVRFIRTMTDLTGNRLASENAPSFGTNYSLVCGLSSRRLMKQSIRQASFFAGRG